MHGRTLLHKQKSNMPRLSESAPLTMPATNQLLPIYRTNRQIVIAALVVGLQIVAAMYFVIDGLDDVITEMRTGITMEVAMECLIALALLAGVIIGAQHMRSLVTQARKRDRALAIAKGALARVIDVRFNEWQLSPGESEVALFAIKGCSIAEIAKMRNAAPGTVRSQLSQVYLKSGVTSQPMLISLFIEELL